MTLITSDGQILSTSGAAQRALPAPLITAQAIGLAWHFNPAELRGRHGEWTRGGQSVSDLPPGSFRRGRPGERIYDLPADEIDDLLGGWGQDSPEHPADPAITSFVKSTVDQIPKMLGSGHEVWNGKVVTQDIVDGQPEAQAALDWHATMHLKTDVANELERAAKGRGSYIDPDTYIVVLHELIHGNISPSEDNYEDQAQAYQNRHGAEIEEGFTQLSSIQHVGEYLHHLGLDDRPTMMVLPTSDPGVSKAREDAAQAIDNLATYFASNVPNEIPPGLVTATRHEANMIRQGGELDTDALRFRVLGGGADQFAQEHPDVKPVILGIQTSIDALDKAARGHMATYQQYAQVMASPDRIMNGTSWNSYPGQVKAAYGWVRAIALREQANGKIGKSDAALQQRITELANQVSGQGPKDKTDVLAAQVLALHGMEPHNLPMSVYQDLRRKIRNDWSAKEGSTASLSSAEALIVREKARQSGSVDITPRTRYGQTVGSVFGGENQYNIAAQSMADRINAWYGPGSVSVIDVLKAVPLGQGESAEGYASRLSRLGSIGVLEALRKAGVKGISHITRQAIGLAAWEHELRGYHGKWEGRDVLVPPMTAADGRKPLDQPGRPGGAGTPDDPIDPQGDMHRAVDLMIAGKHVRLNGPQELPALADEINRRGDAVGAGVGSNPPWDLGNVSVRGTRLFNEQTTGIARANMPQLAGPAQPGSEAALLAGGANKFFIADPEFRRQLERDGISVSNEQVPADDLRATQTQLTATTVSGIARAAAKGSKAVTHMLSEPIWVTSDNYVIDGHHRWAAGEVLAAMQHNFGGRTIEVQRIGLPVSQAIPYANAFAQRIGIATRALGGSGKLVGTANITGQVVDLSSLEAWLTEKRGYHGKWVGNKGIALQSLGIKSRQGWIRVPDRPDYGQFPPGMHRPENRREQTGAYQALGAMAAGQGGAAEAAPSSPEAAGFTGPLAAKVHLGGDPAHWGEIAGALNSIPVPVQERMAKVIGRIEIVDHIPQPEGLGDVGSLAGLYIPGRHGHFDYQGRGEGNGLLQIKSEADIASTALHESMHALDEADGYPSDKLHWRLIARKVRHAAGDRAAPEFQAPEGTGNDTQRAAEEMFAELAAQTLAGEQQYTLDPVRGGKVFYGGPRPYLPPDVAAEVRDGLARDGITPLAGKVAS